MEKMMRAIDTVIRKRMEACAGKLDFPLRPAGADGIFAGRIELAYDYKVDGEVTVCGKSGLRAYELSFNGNGLVGK